MMRSRAADDFSTIRARLKELRHERPPLSETEGSSVFGHPKPNQRATMTEIEPDDHRLPRTVRQKLFG